MDGSDRARDLARARLLTAVLTAGPLLLLGAVSLLPSPGTTDVLVLPAGLFGLVAPAIAWRLQARILERARGSASERRRTYVRSLLVALAVTEGAAMLAVLAWHLSREAVALLALPMHLVLAFALWPSEERLARAEEEASR